MGLATPDRIQKLQRKLYLKAKREPSYRFYVLYDKVYRADVLAHAYALSKANGGAPGVDGVRFEDIEASGRERFLAELRDELREKRYRPDAVLRVLIPKADGGERPLGIPTVKDRVAQTAAKLVLEPIFEADLPDNAYGYRPRRSALAAVRTVHKTLKAGHVHVVDADLSKYFDTIPHADLLRSVARRVSDGAILHLIKMWLKAPVEEDNDRGKSIRRRAGNRGTPQGGVLSPLLANIYMRRFLKAWELRGHEQRFGSRVVSYADDFVILCRWRAADALAEARKILTKIGLNLNETKTRVCDVRNEPFDFLGYRFGLQYRFGSGRSYLAAYPSPGSARQLKAKLRRMVGCHMSWQSEENLAHDVNRVLRGWTNYFSYGTLWQTYGKLERFVHGRIRGWLVHKHRVQSRGECRYPATYIYETVGIIDVTRVLGAARMPTGRTWSESRMREIRKSGSMSGEGKRDHGSRTEAHGESRGSATGS
jgi:RNA-directed DNA polymerase